MTQNLDIDALRLLSEDTRRVYRALARARVLVKESERVGAMADDLLERAGLLFLAEEQVGATPNPSTGHDPTVGMAVSFAQVQRGFVALHEALDRLAEDAVARGLWAEAQPMLKTLHELDAADAHRQELYERSLPLSRAQRALEAGQWEAARQHVEPWLKLHKDDKEARDLLCESYYRPGKQALAAQNWQMAASQLSQAAKLDSTYAEVPRLMKEAMLKWFDFVSVPTGQFLYGEKKEKVHLDEFWISRTPVTNARYQVFVKATGYQTPGHWSNGQPPKGKEQHPVVNVSWDDAQKFCAWAGVSLPGERQWEKAARGSDGRTYPWGEAAPDGRRCNFNNQVGDTTAVGNYPEGASPYGLLDMAGNVWEWCQDAHESGGRVLRGGAFNQDAGVVRCAFRDWDGQHGRGLSSVVFVWWPPAFESLASGASGLWGSAEGASPSASNAAEGGRNFQQPS